MANKKVQIAEPSAVRALAAANGFSRNKEEDNRMDWETSEHNAIDPESDPAADVSKEEDNIMDWGTSVHWGVKENKQN